MKKKEKMYAIIFDKHKKFKEIRILSESSDPFVVNSQSIGDSIYIYTQKEFAKLIESEMNGSTKYINIGELLSVSKKGSLKYYKAPTDTCSDSSSAMPTEACATDATKTIKKVPEEYRSDDKTTCTLTGSIDINPKIEINGAEVSKKIFDDFLKAGSK